jgi:hypothetical protein
MKDNELKRIVEDVGFEQILIDAMMTVEDVAMILHEAGYIDLEMYWDEIYD